MTGKFHQKQGLGADLSAYLRMAQPHEIKLAGADVEKGIISGYGSTFGGDPDSYGDVIAKGAFAASIAQHKADGTAPLMLWAHRPSEPIGRWLEFGEDDRGLFMRGQLNLDTARGRDAHAHIKAGDVNGLSIGFRVLPEGAKPGPNGTTILTNLELLETSVVAFPANRRARVTGVKSFGSRAELEAIIREAGVPSRAVKKLMSGGWPALSGDDEDQPDPAMHALIARLDAATRELKDLRGK